MSGLDVLQAVRAESTAHPTEHSWLVRHSPVIDGLDWNTVYDNSLQALPERAAILNKGASEVFPFIWPSVLIDKSWHAARSPIERNHLVRYGCYVEDGIRRELPPFVDISEQDIADSAVLFTTDSLCIALMLQRDRIRKAPTRWPIAAYMGSATVAEILAKHDDKDVHDGKLRNLIIHMCRWPAHIDEAVDVLTAQPKLHVRQVIRLMDGRVGLYNDAND